GCLGIRDYDSRPWLPREDALLGIVPDEELVERLDRAYLGVVSRRISLGIKAAPPRVTGPWIAKEEKLLGTGQDDEVARRLGRSYCSVRSRRHKLGIRRYRKA